jgi:transcriptional regulator GlxA family with amidase domain
VRSDRTTTVVVAYDGVELADVACVTTALSLAGRCGAHDPYRMWLVSPKGADIDCDSGLTLRAHGSIAAVARCDTLIVSGGEGHTAAAADPLLVANVRRLARQARRVVSVCTGATVLAEAGLLDGRRATTHWAYADELAERYPRVRVDPSPVFVRDGRTATSGGVTASLDLTLALIEEDHGAEVARRVSMGMVTYLQRSGDQDQLSMFTTAARPDHATLRDAVEYALRRPDEDLSTLALAERVNVSPRQLSRLFREHLDETPAAAVRRIRLELAARLLVSTDRQISDVARRCGFASAETLRQAFSARYGVSPRAYRNAHAANRAS